MAGYVTLKDLKKGIDVAIRNKYISECATIIWTANVEKGDVYNREHYATPGSILLGVEWFEGNDIRSGILKIEPPVLSELLN